MKCNYTAQGLVSPMRKASAGRTATVEPHGWVHATLGMCEAKPCADELNSYNENIRKKMSGVWIGAVFFFFWGPGANWEVFMYIQAELSLYALRTKDLSTPIELFSKIFEGEEVRVISGAMSTIVGGERSLVLELIKKAFEAASEHHEVVLTAKFSNACPQAEGGICRI